MEEARETVETERVAALEKQRRVRVIVVSCLADWAFRYRNPSGVSVSGVGHCCWWFDRVAVVFNFYYKRRGEGGEETLRCEFFPEEGMEREGNRW